MAIRIVFIGGVHGVGKSFFCQKLSERFDVEHVAASSLIARYVNQSKEKTVSDIENNQLILEKELSHYKTDRQIILLDGHFCLFNSNFEIQDVPLRTFEGISPYAIILLKGDPLSIIKRLMIRDNKFYSKDQISSLQDREQKRAFWISEALNIPIKVIEPMIDYEHVISEVVLYFAI